MIWLDIFTAIGIFTSVISALILLKVIGSELYERFLNFITCPSCKKGRELRSYRVHSGVKEFYCALTPEQYDAVVKTLKFMESDWEISRTSWSKYT